ncbi:hypothetical protein [Streptomyces rochei]|uniref:hypothetical protein n=1 Tax=Streptomyces rochei TaxID=1928 RepID=UPI00369B411B
MPKPVDVEYRAAILGAFDNYTIRSIAEINNHLKSVGEFKSYRSTLRMLHKLNDEGLVNKLPSRGHKGTIFYTKMVLNQSTARLVSPDKDLLSLGQFITTVMDWDSDGLLSQGAENALKVWMLDTLASVVPEAFEDKRDIPDPNDIRRKLKKMLDMTGKLHGFIKGFLDSESFSPVARNNLAQEFRESPETLNLLIQIVEERDGRTK